MNFTYYCMNLQLKCTSCHYFVISLFQKQKMEVSSCLLSVFVVMLAIQTCYAKPTETKQKWGYVEVREHAHMFWWFYQSYQLRPAAPLVMWLQGGPGASGCGFGNFEEIGELDTSMKVRNYSWIQRANLLFVDNPVGAGFSYVSDPSAYTRNVSQIAEDLFTLFKNFLDAMPMYETYPFYIFAESYGGKMTSAFGTRLLRGIKNKEIKSDFRGVALGDSWISPVDSVITWGPYLYQFNLLDKKDLNAVMDYAQGCVDAVAKGRYEYATELWDKTEVVIDSTTDSVNVYNVLQHHPGAPWKSSPLKSHFPHSHPKPHLQRLYSRHVGRYEGQSLTEFMNGPIRKKLGVIPENVSWGGQSGDVFRYQSGDFMRDVLKDVDTLLDNEISVTVFQGQLDMICDTPGAEMWINKLKWKHVKEFFNAKRKAVYLDSSWQEGKTQAFVKKYRNLQLFYIMKAGHMVPADNPPMALKMLSMITGSW